MPCFNRALMPHFKTTKANAMLDVLRRNHSRWMRRCKTLMQFLSRGGDIPSCVHSRIASRLCRFRRMASRGDTKVMQKLDRLNRLVDTRVRAYLTDCKLRCTHAEAALRALA